MAIFHSWIHGNVLVMESPLHFNPQGEQNGRLVLTPLGWGAEVSVEGVPGGSWMHIPIPTIYRDYERCELTQVNLLFKCLGADIRDIHIYDGDEVVQYFNGLSLDGDYLQNGYPCRLQKSHRVKHGIGLSFRFEAHSGPTPVKLTVAGAGAEFETSSLFVTRLLSVFDLSSKRSP